MMSSGVSYRMIRASSSNKVMFDVEILPESLNLAFSPPFASFSHSSIFSLDAMTVKDTEVSV